MNIENIKFTLQESIQNFRDVNPEKHSYAYIGMKSNNSTSFVERAAKNKLGVPLDPKKVLPLANLVCDGQQTRQVANFFAENLIDQSDILKDAIYAKFVQENDRLLTEQLESYFLDDDSFIAYLLSCADNGVKKEKIIELSSLATLDAMENIRKKGLVNKVEDNYKAIKPKFSFSFKTMKSAIKSLIKHYKTSNIGKERNYIHVETFNFNLEGLKEMQAEHRRHHEAIKRIRENKNLRGDITSFSCGFLDSFEFAKDKNHSFKNLSISILLFSTLIFSNYNVKAFDNYNRTLVQIYTNKQITTVDQEKISFDMIKKIELVKRYKNINLQTVILNDGRVYYSNELTQADEISLTDAILRNDFPFDIDSAIDPGNGAGGGGGRTIDQ